MTDPIKDTRELVKEGHLNQLAQMFKEPYHANMPKEELSKLNELYELGVQQNPEDPLAWVISMERTVPLSLEIGQEDTRVGKVLAASKHFIVEKEKEDDK